MKIKYAVPYEGGFNSGVDYYSTFQEAFEASKQAYGDVNVVITIPAVTNGKPTKEYREFLEK